MTSTATQIAAVENNLRQCDTVRESPNIVFIIVDDMGWADAGCYGSTSIETPHIDRLARQGMRFTQAYSGCTVCAPARSTLMTGYHMGHTSVRSNAGGVPLIDSDVTIAEVLNDAGYVTGGFGKWGLGDLGTVGAAELQGFDEFVGYYHQVHAHDFYPDYLIDTGEKMPLTGNLRDSIIKPGGVPTNDSATGSHRQFSQSVIFERMQAFIRANHDRPFFCYAPWTPPHARYQIPAESPEWQMYKNKDWPLDAKVHAAFVSLVDRCVGETMALLDELGVADDTIVFFCSDNGASQRFEGTLDSSGPLRGYKRALYEGGIRVPLIAHWPGRIDAGNESDHLCYFPDMFPTLCELVGAVDGIPADLDGISMLSTLLGDHDSQQEHDYLYWEYALIRWGENPKMDESKLMVAIRQGDWKAVRQTPLGVIELYDLSNDVGESNNVASGNPDLVDHFYDLLKTARTTPREQPEPPHADGRRFN